MSSPFQNLISNGCVTLGLWPKASSRCDCFSQLKSKSGAKDLWKNGKSMKKQRSVTSASRNPAAVVLMVLKGGKAGTGLQPAHQQKSS